MALAINPAFLLWHQLSQLRYLNRIPNKKQQGRTRKSGSAGGPLLSTLWEMLECYKVTRARQHRVRFGWALTNLCSFSVLWQIVKAMALSRYLPGLEVIDCCLIDVSFTWQLHQPSSPFLAPHLTGSWESKPQVDWALCYLTLLIMNFKLCLFTFPGYICCVASIKWGDFCFTPASCLSHVWCSDFPQIFTKWQKM